MSKFLLTVISFLVTVRADPQDTVLQVEERTLTLASVNLAKSNQRAHVREI